MKRKYLEDMGLDKETVDKIMAENGKDIEDSKGSLEQVKSELKQTKDQLTERDTQLEDLKKSSGDSEELKKQIDNLQEENKKAKETYETEVKELKMNAAIKLALGDTAQDTELVSGLFDKTKLILADDGKVTGLEEQIKSIKESKPFLFKETKPETGPKPGFRPLGAPGQQTQQKLKTDEGKVDMKSAIEAKLQAQIPSNTN